MKDKMVLIDSPDAARHVTGLTGWVSSHGIFFGDGKDAESLARYNGCTHVHCRDCGAPVRKGYLICDECREKIEAARYLAMPTKAWDGKAMLYSQLLDEYYNDIDAASDDAFDRDMTLNDLRLIICEPNYPRQIETDYFEGAMDEEGDLPIELIAAMEAFNAVIAKSEPLSWSPGKFALEVQQDHAS